MAFSLFGLRPRTLAKIALLAVLLVGANLLAREFADALDFTIRIGNEDRVHRTIMISAALYTVMLALPFVPGAEIGVALMAMLGPQIALLVYICTVTGLSLAYLVGRLIPIDLLIGFAGEMNLERTRKLLADIQPLDKDARMAMLIERAPKRLVKLSLRYRYLALAIAFNVPGNYLVGGGGGIALFAGVSRLFSPPGFLLTIALAVAPVPLGVMIYGVQFIAE